jgi:V8-like Glu-specific endopeptidase
MKLLNCATASLLLLVPAPAFAGRALRGTDNGAKVGSAEDVYKLKPRDLTDDQLEAFVVEPKIIRPERDETPPSVPKKLSDDPNDPSFVFEGYLIPDPDETEKKKANKRQRMRDYWYSLDDSEVQQLEGRLKKRRIARDSKVAASRGAPFGERKKVLMTVTDNNEVWSLRMDEEKLKQLSRQVKADEFVGYGGSYEGSEDLSINTTIAKGRGIGLELRSKYNGYNMTEHPWSSQGCISYSNEATGCFCSATKISARLVLTAGHCLYHEMENNPANYWLPGADGVSKAVDSSMDDTPNGAISIEEKYAPEGWWYHENPLYDWGVFTISPTTTTCRLGWFGYEAETNYNSLNIFGYPGQGTCENSPFTSNNCYNSLYGDAGEVFDVRQSTFIVQVDTQGGMSGSGTYELNNGRRVVGVHVRSVPGATDGESTRITDGIFDSIQGLRSQYPDSGC